MGVADHRRPVSKGVYLRRRLVAAVLLLALLAGFGAMVWSLSSSSTNPAPRAASSQVVTTTTSTVPPTTTTTIDPGTLPQTNTEPPSDDTSLLGRLGPIWTAIQGNSLSQGQTVFFPASAYLQMKTGQISNPASDYQSRLIAFLSLDLGAYQQVLGANPLKATLSAVNADPAYATWIPPGSCENSVGYWHLPNVRLVYSSNGTTSSFAVASLISWRGVWYVVHLGPNPRPSNVGTVALPASGAGTPGPPGGC